MPASLLLQFIEKGRFWLFLLLLQISVEPSFAVEKQLASGHVPAVVARGLARPLERMPGTSQLRLALSLPLRNAGELTNLLASIYKPGTPEYHHYLKPGEFAARFGPTAADYDAVIRFARTNGLTVTATHPSRLLVDVTGRAEDVERALHLKLYFFHHPTENRNFFAPDSEPTVDAHLPLLHVGGLDNFSMPHPNVHVRPAAQVMRKSPHGGSSPYGTYMGNDFRQAYVPGTTLTGAGQSVGLLQFDDFHPYDVTNYANAIGMTNNLPEVTVVPVDGGVAYPGANTVEVSLDIEMVMAMSPGVSNIYVYEAPNPSPWEDILGQMADDDSAAQLSSSWSGGGPDPAAEQIFQQMAAQGQTFFNASDDGAAYTNAAEFPCASPNVTEVGGTFLATDTNGNYAGESVWNQGGGVGSGGGVGLSVNIPVWQMGVDMSTNGGSTDWRNSPDVALTADGVYVTSGGQDGAASGTSCAAPLWAGFTALVNQQAAQLGQPPVGFLNPALYSLCRGTNYATTFHDITDGNNTNLISTTNFYAAPGFDLCTGWGTPSGTNLINALTTPEYLGILPSVVISANGQAGGPFSQTNWLVTLTNSGTTDLDWSLSTAPSWLSVSVSNGTLPAGDSTNVCLQLVNAYALAPGCYRTALMFTNEESASVQNVFIELDIGPSIVLNGGFETGDFTGWTLVGDTVTWRDVCNIVATESQYQGVVHSGNFGAFLGQNGYPATLSQTLPTVAGQQYLVSFWLDNLQGGSVQTFGANWDGTNLVNLVGPPAFTWSNFQFIATAIDTNVVLEFAAENDVNYFGFDDVTVTPVPPVVVTHYWVATNGFQMAWPSLAGLNYTVQYTTDLTQSNWEDLGTVLATTNITSFTDTNSPAGSAQVFYRLMLLP